MIENPQTGERIAFVSETPDLLVMESEWTRPGNRAMPHVHPGMEETWRVVEGRGAFRIGDAEVVEAGPGEAVVAPPGVPHAAWNPTEGTVRLRIEMRPALRWREFVERLFGAGGVPTREMLQEFRNEVAPP